MIWQVATTWVEGKEKKKLVPIFRGYSDVNPGFDVNKLISQTIKSRNNSYRVAKQKPLRGIRTFCRPLEDPNTLFIGFERSSLRTFMSFFLGLEKPWFMLDIGNLFFLDQSWFDYVEHVERGQAVINGEPRRVIEKLNPTPENVVKLTNVALDLTDYLLPHDLVFGRVARQY